MTTLIYVESDGTSHQIEASPGENLMQAALNNMVPGILGDCGGICSCATCHVMIDEAWTDLLPQKSETEVFLLEGVPEVEVGSRLGCQIKVQSSMDQMVVRLPAEQF